MSQLRHLFQPIKIGPMEVENRLMISAMGVGFGVDDDGCPTDQLIGFIAERARSRPGMIVSGASYVHPSSRVSSKRLSMRLIYLWDDKVIPSLQRMVEAVHQYNVPFGAQLNHGGLTALPAPAFFASALPMFAQSGLDVREPTKDDICEIVEAFGSAAERCIEAGFDFLEIHCAHGYLIESFLTPFMNRRTDEYGGSIENRIRFMLEVIREVKKRAGEGIPVGLKMSGNDFIPDGAWGMDDLCKVAPILEQEGAAYITVTCGTSTYGDDSRAPMIAPMYVDQGARTVYTEELKKHVSIPVITVGRVKDPVMADSIIRDGKADLVAMARAFVADPEFAQKARSGDVTDIRRCLADCLGCIENIMRYAFCSCTVNPRVGREYQLAETEGDKRHEAKKVLVVGAGPAGLEAARRAAFSGHQVVLCEQRGWIGGQVQWAARMPKREEIGDDLPWYERQLNKYGVEVRLNTPVNDSLVDEIKPNVIVVATGSTPQVNLGFVDDLANIEQIEVVMVDELVEEEKLTGENILIIGGDQIGFQLADFLAEKGKRVSIAERTEKFAIKMAQTDLLHLENNMKGKDITRYAQVRKIEILPIDDCSPSAKMGHFTGIS